MPQVNVAELKRWRTIQLLIFRLWCWYVLNKIKCGNFWVFRCWESLLVLLDRAMLAGSPFFFSLQAKLSQPAADCSFILNRQTWEWYWFSHLTLDKNVDERTVSLFFSFYVYETPYKPRLYTHSQVFILECLLLSRMQALNRDNTEDLGYKGLSPYFSPFMGGVLMQRPVLSIRSRKHPG